jgi:hypothetical protein
MPTPSAETSASSNPKLLSSSAAVTATIAQKGHLDSEARDASSTPVLTPSTPSPSGSPERGHDIGEELLLNMTDPTEPSPGNSDGLDTRQDAEVSGDNPTSKAEVKSTPSVPEPSSKKGICKKHNKPRNRRKAGEAEKPKKKAKESSSSESEGESSSSSSTSSSDSSSSESESSDSAEEKQKRKRKAKARTKGLKEKKKARSRKLVSSSSEESSDGSSSEESPNEKARKHKTKAKVKKKAKKGRRQQDQESSEESEDEDPEERIRAAQQKLAALRLKQGLRPRRVRGGGFVQDRLGGVDPRTAAQRNPPKVTVKKRKRASKVAFKRVDQRESPSSGRELGPNLPISY